MTGKPLTADLMMLLFDELSDHLALYGEHGRVFLVGGAAMALAYDAGRATLDIDALFQPRHAINDAVRVIGERHQLPPDWLNDAVKVFVTADDPDARVVYQTGHLTVSAASPEFLLAMKVRSGRATRDLHDAAVLAEISTAANDVLPPLIQAVVFATNKCFHHQPFAGIHDSVPESNTATKRSLPDSRTSQISPVLIATPSLFGGMYSGMISSLDLRKPLPVNGST